MKKQIAKLEREIETLTVRLGTCDIRTEFRGVQAALFEAQRRLKVLKGGQ